MHMLTSGRYLYWMHLDGSSLGPRRQTHKWLLRKVLKAVPPATGYHFTIDQGYGSLELAQMLNRRHQYFTMTVQSNRPSWLFGNKKQKTGLAGSGLEKGELRWAVESEQNIAAAVWQDHKQVNVLTNMYDPRDVVHEEPPFQGVPHSLWRRQRQEMLAKQFKYSTVKRPGIIPVYIRGYRDKYHKVDAIDQHSLDYLYNWRSAKWITHIIHSFATWWMLDSWLLFHHSQAPGTVGMALSQGNFNDELCRQLLEKGWATDSSSSRDLTPLFPLTVPSAPKRAAHPEAHIPCQAQPCAGYTSSKVRGVCAYCKVEGLHSATNDCRTVYFCICCRNWLHPPNSTAHKACWAHWHSKEWNPAVLSSSTLRSSPIKLTDPAPWSAVYKDLHIPNLPVSLEPMTDCSVKLLAPTAEEMKQSQSMSWDEILKEHPHLLEGCSVPASTPSKATDIPMLLPPPHSSSRSSRLEESGHRSTLHHPHKNQP